jgi:hypothetical protein
MSGQHLKRQVVVRLMECGPATAARLPEVAECLSSIGVSTTTKKLHRDYYCDYAQALSLKRLAIGPANNVVAWVR